MNEILIRTSFRLLCPLLVIISFVFLLRGHNLPGGGFIGGLILSLSMILLLLANRDSKIENLIRDKFTKIVACCLIGLSATALLPLFFHKPILTGLWTKIPLPIAGKLSSILFFDLFIYLVVAVSITRAYVEFTDFSGEGRSL
jgi:multicomponent Na+:H+ antiporter subunit B